MDLICFHYILFTKKENAKPHCWHTFYEPRRRPVALHQHQNDATVLRVAVPSTIPRRRVLWRRVQPRVLLWEHSCKWRAACTTRAVSRGAIRSLCRGRADGRQEVPGRHQRVLRWRTPHRGVRDRRLLDNVVGTHGVGVELLCGTGGRSAAVCGRGRAALCARCVARLGAAPPLMGSGLRTCAGWHCVDDGQRISQLVPCRGWELYEPTFVSQPWPYHGTAVWQHAA